MNLSAKEKVSYGIGAVGKDMVYMLTASYILYFYEDILGVSAVFTGILLLAARVFDAANDPVMGILVARTKSRFGRFRPWLFSGTIVNALVLYAMFAVPEELEGNPLGVFRKSKGRIRCEKLYPVLDVQIGRSTEEITTIEEG